MVTSSHLRWIPIMFVVGHSHASLFPSTRAKYTSRLSGGLCGSFNFEIVNFVHVKMQKMSH